MPRLSCRMSHHGHMQNTSQCLKKGSSSSFNGDTCQSMITLMQTLPNKLYYNHQLVFYMLGVMSNLCNQPIVLCIQWIPIP